MLPYRGSPPCFPAWVLATNRQPVNKNAYLPGASSELEDTETP